MAKINGTFSAKSIKTLKVNIGDTSLTYRCSFREDLLKKTIKVWVNVDGTKHERWVDLDMTRSGGELIHYRKDMDGNKVGRHAGLQMFFHYSDGHHVYHNFDDEMCAEAMGRQFCGIALMPDRFEGWINYDKARQDEFYGVLADCILFAILTGMYSKKELCQPVMKLVAGWHWDGERLARKE